MSSSGKLVLHGVRTNDADETILVVKRPEGEITDAVLNSWRKDGSVSSVHRVASDTAEVTIPRGARTLVAQQSFVELFNNMEA